MFSIGEQELRASKGFTNEPGRCPDCRASRPSDRGGGSGGYSGGGYRRQEREMYSTTCSTCGQEARVPFQPGGDKPVCCSDCFTPRQGGAYSSGRAYR